MKGARFEESWRVKGQGDGRQGTARDGDGDDAMATARTGNVFEKENQPLTSRSLRMTSSIGAKKYKSTKMQ